MNKYFTLLSWSVAGVVAGLITYYAAEGVAVVIAGAGVFKGFKEFMNNK